MGAAVHFKGIENVVSAYEARKVAAWCICQAKAMIFKYEPAPEEGSEQGAQYLADCLEMIKDSNAVYTLKVFEDPAGKIRSNTPDDGAFNFRILDEPLNTVGSMERQGVNNLILSELATIKKTLDEKQQEQDEQDYEDNEGVNGIQGTLAGIIGNPAIQPILTSLLTTWLTKQMPDTFKPVETAAAVSNALQIQSATMQQSAINGQDPELINAISTLKSYDPLLSAHLTKLAKIASTRPAVYQQLTLMLNKEP